MDFSKLKPSDWLVGGGTVVFLIALFLPWYKAEVDGFGGGSVNGWSYFLFGIIPLILLAFATVASVVPKLTDSEIVPDPVGPLPRAQAVLIAAGAAAVIVLLRILIKDDGDVPSILQDEIDISRGIGLFLGFLAAAAAAAGAFMKFQDKEEIGSGPSSAPPTPF
jgi:hypothetical protein